MKHRPIEVIGSTASPYTRKLIALLRYRRIPHIVHWQDVATVLRARGLALPKVVLLPTVLLPVDDTDVDICTDSTPILRRLDEHFAKRRVRPVDPALALMDSLLEDFADEWGTKLMFHHRWHFSADAAYNATLLPLTMDPQMTRETQRDTGQAFSERQIGRLGYVGSNEVTGPIIEAAYVRLLECLDAHLAAQRFLLGRRPGACDFAIYGQLSQLTQFDPTPRRIAHETAPRLSAWTMLTDDLSGWEIERPAWVPLEQHPETLKPLLAEIGKVYAPLLVANARAVAAGERQFSATVDGMPWTQQTFPYQAKCLTWLREEYQALSREDRERFNSSIAGSGCEVLFAD